ncbi:MAG: T9SS-dependent M36 family metallopeptidase [Saprospiraceae bacterium]|nr:T9SS-dependent M36 family metallopeptidase [Saprospiraceae bacterium]
MILLRLPRLWLAVALVLFVANATQAQTADRPRETAIRFLQENPAQFGLTKADVSDLKVTDEYLSKHNGVTHVWVQQQHKGIPLFNGLFGLHVKPDGSVLTLGHRFVPELSAKVNTILPSLSASKAVEMAFANLGFTGFQAPALRQKINDRNFVFDGGAVSKSEIPVSACFELQRDGSVRLAWTLVIEQATSSDIWNMRVDAQTGLVLSKYNHTVYCQAGHAHRVGDVCDDEQPAAASAAETSKAASPPQASGTYNVFALPVESPAHGDRSLVVNPADPVASPYGWHDTNGAPGAEYTYTRGNNVWAYDDRNNDNVGTAAESAQGGPSLIFDFPYDPNGEPLDNLDAAITNLFYMNNMLHDITYRFGFDEQAGNFQVNNYGKGGAGNDAVQANAIDGFTAANQSVNNANFSTPPDGSSPRMQMFVWTRSGGQLLTVDEPGPVAGSYSVSTASGWGAPITDTPVTGLVEIVNDGTSAPTLGCGPLQNDLTGKIALVDRQVCQFGVKALNAQNAGAIGCIICNFEEGLVNMAAGTAGGQVNIPVVMLKKSDCDQIRQYAGSGLIVSLVQPGSAGPEFIDGDFDNGIIAHEYGHGISNRLTGGPNNTACLSNEEQMGEGWSDFFTLVKSARPGDFAEKRRGIGTFVLRQNNEGTGIRRYPYSANMAISPVTYGTVAENTQVHALGEVWAAMTWDLYWAMVEKYGFDPDLTNPNSGNARAIQLVMDGMKLQPCRPGFVDGRDAIMAADILNYDGADTCLISAVFARRGLGYLADQGSNADAADGVENFDPIPTCIKEVKIKKETTTPLIEPGEIAEFKITITNHRDETANDVVVLDELPSGLTLVSASDGGTFANGYVTWNLGAMPTGQVKTLTYSAKSADFVGSLRYFQDPLDSDGEWLSFDYLESGHFFSFQSDEFVSGDGAWLAETPLAESRFSLEYIEETLFTVSGNQPVLRFWHQYDTEPGVDAGIVEIKRAGEQAWDPFPEDRLIRNPYPRKVAYNTFAQAYLSGFSGHSDGWVQTYIDLSDYAGQNVSVRFRVGTNAGSATGAVGKWYVDEIEVLDLYNFDSEACVSSEGEVACAKAPARGVIVQPGIVSTDAPGSHQLPMRVQPNPAADFVHISVGQALTGQVRVQLIGADGRTALARQLEGIAAGQIVTLDVQQVPAGIYMVRLESATGSSVKKVVIR